MSTPNTILCTPSDAKTKQTPCFDAHAPHASARLLVTFMRISHKGEASQPRQGGLASGRKKSF